MNQTYKFEPFDWQYLANPDRLTTHAECLSLRNESNSSYHYYATLAANLCSAHSAMVGFFDQHHFTVFVSVDFNHDDNEFVVKHLLSQAVVTNAPVLQRAQDAQTSHQVLAAFPIVINADQIVGILCIAHSNVDVDVDNWITNSLSARRLLEADINLHLRFKQTELDVVRLRRSEARLESALAGMSLVNEIGTAARSGDDPDSILLLAVTKLGEALNADRCYYVTYDAKANKGTIAPDWHRPCFASISAEYDMLQFNYNQDDSFHAGKTSVVEDILELPNSAGNALSLRLGLRSLLRAPIQRGKQMTALAVAMSVPRKWTDDEIRLVETVAAQTRAAVETASQMVRERSMLRDVLATVTAGRLLLVSSDADIPTVLNPVGQPIVLDHGGGLSKLREATRNAAALAGHTNARTFDLVMATGEAGMNAIVHANVGEAQVSFNDAGTVQVRVRDQGSGIAIENIPKATLARGFSTKATLGHGLKIMLETVDRIYLLTGSSGTTVVLEKDREPRESGWDTAF